MMPMMNALGYVQYVVVAVVGAWLAISGATNLTLVGTNTATLGMIASFLTIFLFDICKCYITIYTYDTDFFVFLHIKGSFRKKLPSSI